jgi:AcrR family transcriptional regulator
VAVKKQAVKQQTGVDSNSRQAAYSARNRARLIKDAQMVLAEIGPSATIEQIASHAEVSPTTIYKYFENKDQLFLEALSEAWDDFILWAISTIVPGDMLEVTLDTGRKLFWARKSHPLFADMLHNSLNQIPDFVYQADMGESKSRFKELVKAELLKPEDFDERWALWVSIYSGLLRSVFVSEELTPAQANVAFGIGLSIWGVSDVKAKKLISRQVLFEVAK